MKKQTRIDFKFIFIITLDVKMSSDKDDIDNHFCGISCLMVI